VGRRRVTRESAREIDLRQIAGAKKPKPLDLATVERRTHGLKIGEKAQLDAIDKRPPTEVARVGIQQRMLTVDLNQAVRAGTDRLQAVWRAGPLLGQQLTQ